ncbi:MAG: flagellar basal body rod protein FlgB [Candidatus Aureabacteria bacterium]|nr:flagellar basal body rod protein FlgB [Candidatus Auribacterota bacterium]
MDKIFEDKRAVILKKILDLTAMNQKVIANNIANVETPGFIAKKLNFNEALKQAVESGDLQRIESVTASISDNYDSPFRMDMNNVDMEKELVAMEENRTNYELAATLLKKRLVHWREVFENVKN